MKKNRKVKETEVVKEEFDTELGEDATKYGEFVCSYFAWVSPEEQKQKVERMEKITKNNSQM